MTVPRWLRRGWIGALLALTGLALIGGGVAGWIAELRFAAGAELVEGVVVEAPTGGSDSPDQSFGRVQFPADEPRLAMRLWPGSGSGTLREGAIRGDRVGVLVPRDAMRRARLADWQGRFALKVTLLFMGVVMMLVGVGAIAAFSGTGLGGVALQTRTIAIAFLCVGLLLCSVAAASAWSSWRWLQRSETVIGVAQDRGGAVRVGFTTDDGRMYHALADWLPDAMPFDRPRIAVPVRYDPRQPYVIRAYDPWTYWETNLFLGGFALAFTSVPLLGLWLMRRQR